MEHILVFEQATGLSVPKNCAIHHLDGNKSNNKLENLCLMERGAHTAFHSTGRKVSDLTKKKMSEKAKERLKDPRNHPMWRIVDIDAIELEIANGATVKDACAKHGISKDVYYKRRSLKLIIQVSTLRN